MVCSSLDVFFAGSIRPALYRSMADSGECIRATLWGLNGTKVTPIVRCTHTNVNRLCIYVPSTLARLFTVGLLTSTV